MAKKLINLIGIGINGKSHIVEELMNSFPDLIHLPQTNREFYKLHEGQEFTEDDIYQFYIDRLEQFYKDYENSDGVFITERDPLSYLSYSAATRPNDDLSEFTQRVIDDYNAFNKFFDQNICNFKLYNLDCIWLHNYIKGLDRSDLHRRLYKSRGYYIILQDRFFNTYNKYSEGRGIDFYMQNFYSDNNNVKDRIVHYII